MDASWFGYDLADGVTGPGVGDILLNELGATGRLVLRDAGTEAYRNNTGQGIAVLSGPAGETRIVAPGESATVPGRLREITTQLSTSRASA